MKSAGFTLVELLVTISIFIIMTGLILSRYGAFNQGTLITNLAYDVALTVRTAQTYGVSVKGNEIDSGVSSQAFSAAYGVHFDQTAANSKSFFIYVDNGTSNNAFNASDQIASTYNLKQGAKISGLCASKDAGATCTPVASTLDISFKRPDPSAIICADGPTGCTGNNYAAITVMSADNSSSRVIVVRGNGQISVGN